MSDLDNRTDGSQSHPWDISGIPDGNYYIRIEAFDGLDIISDETAGSITIITYEATTTTTASEESSTTTTSAFTFSTGYGLMELSFFVITSLALAVVFKKRKKVNNYSF